MEFSNMNAQQQMMATNIEMIYINHKQATLKDFISSVCFVLNKYKKLGDEE